MIDEKISKHLGKPYIYLKDKQKFLCSNGVLFTLEEFKNGIDINAEYERRPSQDNLYDYQYAKNTGILRKKRGYAKKQEDNKGNQQEEVVLQNRGQQVSENIPDEPKAEREEIIQTNSDTKVSRRDGDTNDRQEKVTGKNRSIFLIILILAFASVCSMYESTLHTAT